MAVEPVLHRVEHYVFILFFILVLTFNKNKRQQSTLFKKKKKKIGIAAMSRYCNFICKCFRPVHDYGCLGHGCSQL